MAAITNKGRRQARQEIERERMCRCGHPEAEHGAYPPHECLIHRRSNRQKGFLANRQGAFLECGCTRFQEAP